MLAKNFFRLPKKSDEVEVIFAKLFTKKGGKFEEKHYNYFIFGHRHLPLQIDLGKDSKYVNLGDWITHFTYGVFDGKSFLLEKWKNGISND